MLKKTLSEIEFKNLDIAGGGREEPVLPPAKLVAQSKQASFGRWKSFKGLGRTKEACSKSSHGKVCANRHRGLSPRSPDLAKEDRAAVEVEGAAWRGPRLLWRGQEYQSVASQGQEETVNRFF